MAGLLEEDRWKAARVVVAGWGLISPLGLSAWETFTALCSGRMTVDRITKTAGALDAVQLVQRAGSVRVSWPSAVDPTVELAERAAREAGLVAGMDLRGVMTFAGTSKGAVLALTLAADALRQKLIVRARDCAAIDEAGFLNSVPINAQQAVALGPHGYLSFHLRRRLGLGPLEHSVAACASGLTGLHRARQWLSRSGNQLSSSKQINTALVVSADSALLPLFVHSYRKLGVLASFEHGAIRNRPLDQDRSGFLLSECGAAIVLKRLAPGTKPRPGQIELVDTVAATDSHDLIRPSPRMRTLRRIAGAMFKRNEVSVIHPHAPGTADHDPVELQVYADVLAQGNCSPVDLYANKGAVGHVLGASGLLSLVLACVSLEAGKLPPMPWLNCPLKVDSKRLRFDAEGRDCDRRGTHAVFAAGFGGHIAGALVRRH